MSGPVIRLLRPSVPLPRPVLMTLACLAIALRILIPPGFMAAPPTNDLPFPIVLCTAQGAITVGAGQTIPGHGGDAPGAADNGHCLFAGAAVTAPPPQPVVFEQPAPLHGQAPLARSAVSLAPGRGLAAPPPPARGPPDLLI